MSLFSTIVPEVTTIDFLSGKERHTKGEGRWDEGEGETRRVDEEQSECLLFGYRTKVSRLLIMVHTLAMFLLH